MSERQPRLPLHIDTGALVFDVPYESAEGGNV